MDHTIFHSLRTFVADYGYWGVALALLCENAGIPVPGETTLLLASFLAYSEHRLHLGWIIVVATCAATLGDNLGYAIGYFGGRPLLDRYQNIFRIPQRTLKNGEALFERYGPGCHFLRPFCRRHAGVCGAIGGRAAHALARVRRLQLPGRGRLGFRDRQCRIPVRGALA